MTTEKQRIAIAEACGWEFEHHATFCGWKNNGHVALGIDELPNYPSDLNAMHEAEMTLTFPQKQQYILTLEHINACQGVGFASVFATASQRAEVFLRTIGKWEE